MQAAPPENSIRKDASTWTFAVPQGKPGTRVFNSENAHERRTCQSRPLPKTPCSKLGAKKAEKIAKIDRGKFTIAKMDRLVFRNFNAVHFGIFTTLHAPKFVPRLAWVRVRVRVRVVVWGLP